MMKSQKYLIFLIFLFSIKILSQTSQSYLTRNTNFSSGFVYQNWRHENNVSIYEMVIPFSFTAVVDKNITLMASTNTAYSKLSSSNDNILGFTDSRISGTFTALENKFLLSVGVAVPSGKTKIEQSQIELASAIAQYHYNFRVPSYSQGLIINITSAYAFVAGNFVFGTGLGIVHKRGFEPFSYSNAVYKSGSEFSVNIGGETRISGRKGTRLSLDLNYTFYGSDTYDNEKVLKSGNRFIINFKSFTKIKNIDLLFYLRERTKGKNEIGIGNLKEESKNTNGNQFDAGSMGFIHLNQDFTIKSLIEVKIYSQNEYEQNGALIYGFGGGINYLLTRDFMFDLLLILSYGKLSNMGNTSSIRGYEISSGLKLNL